jgi:hypothetical protein
VRCWVSQEHGAAAHLPPYCPLTMIPDLDIHRSAWSMIRRYGDDAEAQAAMRGDELLDRGDLDGSLVWQAIISAIRRLQVEKPEDGAAVH